MGLDCGLLRHTAWFQILVPKLLNLFELLTMGIMVSVTVGTIVSNVKSK